MPDYSQIDQSLVVAHGRFASAIKTWLIQNDWPQKVTDDWARDADCPCGPWASQICKLFQEGYNPRPSFWIALAEFNRVVADQQFTPLKDQKLKGRLRDARPFVDVEGNVATASTLYSMFIGQESIPVQYAGFTDQTAELYSKTVADMFEDLVLKSGQPGRLAWKEVENKLPIEPDPWTDTVHRVALRLHVLTGSELTQLLGALDPKTQDDPIVSALLAVDRKYSYVSGS